MKDQTMLVTRYCNQHGGHTAAVLRATRPPHANTASAARIGRRSAPRAARSCPCVHAALGRCVLARRSVMRARSCWNTHRVVFQEVGHVVDHVIDHHPAVRLRAVLRHLSEADLAEVRRHAPLEVKRYLRFAVPRLKSNRFSKPIKIAPAATSTSVKVLSSHVPAPTLRPWRPILPS